MESDAAEYPTVDATEIVTVQLPPRRKVMTASVRLYLPEMMRWEIEHTSLVDDENERTPVFCASEMVWVMTVEPALTS